MASFEEHTPQRALDLLLKDEADTTGPPLLPLSIIGRAVELLEQDGLEEDPPLITRVDI